MGREEFLDIIYGFYSFACRLYLRGILSEEEFDRAREMFFSNLERFLGIKVDRENQTDFIKIIKRIFDSMKR